MKNTKRPEEKQSMTPTTSETAGPSSVRETAPIWPGTKVIYVNPNGTKQSAVIVKVRGPLTEGAKNSDEPLESALNSAGGPQSGGTIADLHLDGSGPYDVLGNALLAKPFDPDGAPDSWQLP